MRKLCDAILKTIPQSFRRRVGYKLLRSTTGDCRALVELFAVPYSQWPEWESGLGEAHALLYSLVRLLRPRIIVEIGSARGKSTCSMALACEHNSAGTVNAIDPHTTNAWTDLCTHGDTLGFLMSRLAAYGLAHRCNIIQSTSVEVAKSWNAPIDLLFIDGDHSYEMVKHDFEAFRPWLSDSALVVFHDTLWAHHCDPGTIREGMGVPRFLQELQDAGYNSITMGPLPGITILDPRLPPNPFSSPAELVETRAET